jgi:NAD(P)-dependent dehydrogenase (short-subunit alcohol dehydrogenase family)
VTAAGGVGHAIQCDHTQPEQVEALFIRINSENPTGVDILVNSVWGCDALIDWGKSFYEMDVTQAVKIVERAVVSHVITNRFAVPGMVANSRGLIVEVTDGATNKYRDHLLYDLCKLSVMRLAVGMSEELKKVDGVTALAITPGFLRSEAMLEHFKVTSETWRDAIKQDKFFEASETPHFLGRAIASLAGDRDVGRWSGQTLATWDLARVYNFRDLDGSQPHWMEFYEANK